MNSFITVQSFASRIEAEIVKGLLESNGIRSIIFSDDGGGMRPFPMSYVPGVELKVSKEDFEKARKIVTPEKSKA
ncbi:hypothetical protein A3D77_06135 [Candidatus Gottesmanbacteria bacterium RIFCSPHIGHO2_02_FULL_39_11]|uniref:DUF2007 domain-containing protein n=1 Tax=Candidatus Gottesmanbacteria bacterium RIFCSPHIGHO2_02_FULL_39_11 TaxID=1798382 RepID=A0A1F5ZWP4_9BACT|nr:MAG: hypothetical protein A3D77_06135 [Candidatus Gottesmanbacteria bacterium RIFCSPHIGHO2_02_FULL_39_11]